jgi:hypothetical protein
MMIGFTPLETFDSDKDAHFGWNGFTGTGLYSFSGDLCYPVDKDHNIIDKEISQNAEEIISILTISDNGAKKEIRWKRLIRARVHTLDGTVSLDME